MLDPLVEFYYFLFDLSVIEWMSIVVVYEIIG
jgi:hypothetical protein